MALQTLDIGNNFASNLAKNFDCYGCPNLHSLDGIGKVKGKIFSDVE